MHDEKQAPLESEEGGRDGLGGWVGPRWRVAGRWPWRRLAWLGILGAGVVQVVSRRFLVAPDALSYLDLADAWRALLAGQGAWGEAVNAYWSPLCSWWMALVLGVVRPAPIWESTVVHAGQWVVLVFCLLAFESFWYQVLFDRCQVLVRGEKSGRSNRCQVLVRGEESGGSNRCQVLVRGWGWGWALGYSLFAATILGWVTVWELTPDLWAAIWLFLQGAMLLRLLRSEGMEPEPTERRRWAFLLGLWIGLGYFTKVALLPIAVMGVGSLVVLARRRWAMVRGLWPAVAGVAMLVVPWAILLSVDLGRPTLGEAGGLNYAWYVNGAFGGGQHWQGEGWPPGAAGLGQALHPTRCLGDDPPIFEFAGPVVGTYPPWRDPVYWHEGIEPHFDLGRQLGVVKEHLGIYAELFGRHGLALLAGVVWLVLGRGRVRGRSALLLALFALGPLAMYALVHVELRFLGALGVFLGGASIVGARTPESDRGKAAVRPPVSTRLAPWLVVVALVGLLGPTAWDLAALVVRQRVAWVDLMGTSAHHEGQAAQALRDLGLGGPQGEGGLGERVPLASIGYGMEAYWARLAGARVVVEVYRRDDQPELSRSDEAFWALEPADRRRVLGRLAAAGARAVVTRRPPVLAAREGWRRLGTSERFVLPLTREVLDDDTTRDQAAPR